MLMVSVRSILKNDFDANINSNFKKAFNDEINYFYECNPNKIEFLLFISFSQKKQIYFSIQLFHFDINRSLKENTENHIRSIIILLCRCANNNVYDL